MSRKDHESTLTAVVRPAGPSRIMKGTESQAFWWNVFDADFDSDSSMCLPIDLLGIQNRVLGDADTRGASADGSISSKVGPGVGTQPLKCSIRSTESLQPLPARDLLIVL